MASVKPSTRAVWLPLLFVLCCMAPANLSLIAQDPSSDASAEEQKEKLAADKFLELLIKKPATGTALDRVFGYHVERGTISNLLSTLTEKAQGGGSPDETGRHWFLIGLLQLQRGEDSQAVTALALAQEQLKDNALAAFHHGQALLLVGKTDAAASAFEAAIARKPVRNDYLNVARELGRLYQRAGKSEDALRIWNDLEKNFPGDDSVRQRIASTLVEEGDIAGALSRYEAMAKSAKAENDRINFAMDAARLKSQLGQKDQAIKDFDALLTKLRPGSYLYDEARRRIEGLFLSNGDYAGLTRYYEQWLKDHPDDLNVILRSARTLSLQGRSAEAIERFEQAIQRAPNDENARLACVEAYIAANRFADAAKQFESLIKVNPKNPDYLVRYGQVLLSDKQKPESERTAAAAEVWKRLTEAKPKDAAVHSQVADLLRGAKLTDAAIASYRQAIALAPNEPQHKEYLGEYLHQLKRTEEALAVWRSLADGDARNLENLVRLAEVYHQFEQPAEALKTMAEACQLKPKVAHRLRYVEWLCEAKEFDKANEQLQLANQEVETAEDRARAFAAAVKAYQQAGKLEEQIKLAVESSQAAPGDGERLRQLAMLYEANNNPQEALKAIEQAVAAAPNSIETLDVGARMSESSGRLAEAIDLRKKLVDLDRRFRSAHLQRLAMLYANSGQVDAAIATGKELLASAGGAIDSFRFYAGLCGQLGRTEERLDTLRRCLRLNPRSPDAIDLLANQLAEDFKTDQAIELVWKLLDLAEDIEKRREAVTRLTDLYLRSNRLDQLISRLEFRGRESNDRRTAIDLMATAYQQAGDFGLARDALETLLRESGRDTLLMERLSALAQQAGEIDRALELQRELVRLAPSKQAEARLASLLVDVGSLDEAQSLWLSSVDLRTDVGPVNRAIDQLFASGEFKGAYDLAGKVLQANPADWEILCKRMVLAALADEWTDATSDAQTLLSMNLAEDEESPTLKQLKAQRGRANSSPLPGRTYLSGFPPAMRRLQEVQQLWMMLDPSYGSRNNALPSPQDFGAARLFAKFTLLKRDDEKGEVDKKVAQLKQAAMSDKATAKEVWEWYSTESLLARSRRMSFDQYRDPSTWTAMWRVVETDPETGLYMLSNFFNYRQQYISNTEISMMPLPEERLQWLKEQAFSKTAPRLANSAFSWLAAYSSELIIAGKKEEAEKILKEKQNWPNAKGPQAYEILAMVSRQGSDDELWEAIGQALAEEKVTPQTTIQHAHQLASSIVQFTLADRVNRKLSLGAADPTYRQRVMQLVDQMLQAYSNQPMRGNTSIRLTQVGGPRNVYQIINNNYQEIIIEFPPLGLGPDDEIVRVLYMVHQQLKDHTDPWIERLLQADESQNPRTQVDKFMAAAFILYWGENREKAREVLDRSLKLAVEQVPQLESTLRLLLADLLLRQDRKQDALAMIEQLSVYDQNTMAVREFAAARLASVLGDKPRAEQAAKRLIGVRLDTDAQIELAKLLRTLNMNDLASDVVRRMRGRTGGNTTQLQSLLTYFLSQDDKEAAAEVAMDLLQRTAPTFKRQNNSMTMNEAIRRQALQALASCGKLQPLVESTKQRMERAPNSQRLRAELAEMYRMTGQVQELDQLLNKGSTQKGESTAALEANAKQLVQANKHSEACDVYLKLLRRNPQLFSREFYEIERPFSRSKRLGELAEMIVEVGPQKFEGFRVAELCDRLIREPADQAKAKKLFLAVLNQRVPAQSQANLLNNLSNSFHQLVDDEEVLGKLLDLMIASSMSQSQLSSNTWSELFAGYSTSSDARKNSSATYLVRHVATKPPLAAAMEKRLRVELEKNDSWQEGKVWLAILLAATKRHELAKELLEPLLDKLPQGGRDVFWVIGSQIDSAPALYPLAEKIYELASKNIDSRYGSDDFQFTFTARLSRFMVDNGKKDQAKAVVLAELEKRKQNPPRRSIGDAEYEAYQAINQTISLMSFLCEVDAPIEALTLGRKLDRDNFAKAVRYGDLEKRFQTQVQEVEAKLRKLGGLALLESSIDAETKGEYAVDFGITQDERPFTGPGFRSLWTDKLTEVSASGQTELLSKLTERLQQLSQARPQDQSVRVALALISARPDAKTDLEALIKEGLSTESSSDVKPEGKADPTATTNSLQTQWLAMAYLYWMDLSAGSEGALDTASVTNWLDSHTAKWSERDRIQLVAAIGKRFLTRKDRAAAKTVWSRSVQLTGGARTLLLDLAIAAAREDMPELSLQSATVAAKATDAVPAASPGSKAASSLGELLQTRQSSNVIRSRSTNLENDTRNPLAERLVELDNAWLDKKVEAALLVEPLSAWVLVNETNIQPLPVHWGTNYGSNSWKLESVFARLAKRAAESQQTEKVVAVLVGKDPAMAAPEALAKADPQRVLLISLAWIMADRGDKAVDYLKVLNQAQLSAVNMTLVLQTLTAALENQTCRRTAADLSLAWAAANKPTERYATAAPYDKLTREVVRKSIDAQMPKELRSSAVTLFLELSRLESERYEGSMQATQALSQLHEVVQMLLTGGNNEEALIYLGQRQAMFNQGADRDDDWLGSWLLENIQSKTNRLEAYQLLAEWTFQGDANLNSIRAFSRRAPLPDWIPPAIGGTYPNFAPIVVKDVPLVSSYYSLALLSDEVKRSDELLARYQAARDQKRAGATVGLAITLAALKRDVPEALLKELSDYVQSVRPLENTNTARAAAPLPELHLALILISHGQHLDWARDMVDEALGHSTPAGRPYLTPWLRRYQYLQGRSEYQTLQPVQQLKHWTASVFGGAKDFYEGKTPTLWLTDHQDQLVHVSGYATDLLWLKYPLEGNFVVEFETPEGKGREMELTVSGLRFSIMPGYTDVISEDNRDFLRYKALEMKKGEFNKHLLEFTDSEMRYTVNGQQLYKEPRGTAPVSFAFRSLATRQTVARGIKISGQPKIARSLPLLDQDHLRGWTGYYYSQQLPSSKLVESGGTGPVDYKSVGQDPSARGSLGWTIANGELISGEGRTNTPGNQSLIQASRPLSVGDKLEYEFFYEPGKFEVHPALGRTAFLIDAAGCQRHWMTEPNTSWKTPADNRFPIPGARPLALQVGQWNKVTIELRSGQLVMSMNDQAALELPWDAAAPGNTFGLYRLQGAANARVRNIVLTGDWPTDLPAELMVAD